MKTVIRTLTLTGAALLLADAATAQLKNPPTIAAPAVMPTSQPVATVTPAPRPTPTTPDLSAINSPQAKKDAGSAKKDATPAPAPATR